MKVNETTRVQSGVVSGGAVADRPPTGVAQAPQGPVDKVSVQSAAALPPSVDQVRSQREARVRELGEAVESGSYRPDPARVARRIVDDAELAARLRAMLG